MNEGGPRGGKRLAAFAVLTIAVLTAVTLANPTRATSIEPVPFGYASCSPDGVHHTEITHVCHQGDQIRATLRSPRPLDYRVCLRFAEGPTSCEDERRVEAGTSSIVNLPSQNYVGLLRVSWQSESKEIADWNIRFVKDPVVPAFGISPLVISGAHRLFGLQIRHISGGLRVRAWRECRVSCRLPLRLVSHKGENRRYRITGSARNSTFALGDLLYVQVDSPRGEYRGAKLWGRLYRGKLVRDHSGGPGDTAIRRIKPTLCTPPGKTFRRATSCRKVPGSSTTFRRLRAL